jgi:hypothetical protein
VEDQPSNHAGSLIRELRSRCEHWFEQFQSVGWLKLNCVTADGIHKIMLNLWIVSLLIIVGSLP